MRILHATECAAMGTLQVILALTRELHSEGAEHTIIYCERAGETPQNLRSLFPRGVSFTKVASATSSPLRFMHEFPRALRRCVRDWQPDIVHLHSSKAGFVGRLALAAPRPRCQVLYSPHGLAFLDPDRPLRNSVFRMLERAAACTSATLVGCSQSETDLLNSLSCGRAISLENPVGDEFFSITNRQQAHRVIVTVGRLARQKSPERFAALARTLREQLPDVRCVWVGDGEFHYKAELEEAGCEVTGWVDRSTVIEYLSAATVYVQTSRWEGLPLAVIQAMAAGVPCVVNDCAGNRDAIDHGSTGFITQTAEEMVSGVRRLLEEPATREQMGAEARREALRRFGSKAFRKRVFQVYGMDKLPYLPSSVLQDGAAS